MTDSASAFDFEDRLDELLDAWYDQIEVGKQPEPAELCRDCPEMLFPLTQAIQRIQQIDKLLDSPKPTPAANRFPLPERIGPFEVLSELGRGGMGVVYRCRQRGTDREIAVKVLQPHNDSEEDSGRFRREMLAAGAITDPGVVHIYDAGIDETGPIRWRWIAMEHIKGVHLDRYVFQEELNANEIIQIIRQICASVSALHQKGIIHQDLKPSNILVDASGRPQILDFGISATLEPEGEVQLDNAPLTFGTLPYLPPEAVDSAEGNTDVRTDIYALGVILFELLTNNSMRSWHETTKVLQHATDFESRHEWLTLETAGLQYDLRQIVLKAVCPDRNLRYSSVDALSADLQRFVDGYPAEAAGARQWRRAFKWCLRNRVAAVAAMLTVATLTGWTLSILGYERQNSMAATDLEQKEMELEREQVRLDIGLENHEYLKTLAYVDSDPNHAFQRLSQMINGKTHGCLAHKLLLKRSQWLERQIIGAPSDITSMAFSADTKQLVAHSRRLGTYRYDLITRGQSPNRVCPDPGRAMLGCSPDAQFRLLHSKDDGSLVLSTPQGNLPFSASQFGGIRCGDVSPDGTAVALGTLSGNIVVVSLNDMSHRVWTGDEKRIVWIAWDTPQCIVSCTPAGAYRVINADSMTLKEDRDLQATYPQLKQINRFDYSESMDFGECLLLVQRNTNAFTFHPDRQPQLASYYFTGFNPSGVHLVPPRSLLIATDTFVSLSDAYTHEKRWVMRQPFEVTATGVSRNGQLVAIATQDERIEVYRTSPTPWSEEVVPGRADDAVHDIISACSKQRTPNPILLGTAQGRLLLWDAVRDCVLHQIDLSDSAIGSVSAFVQDEKNFTAIVSTGDELLAVFYEDGKVSAQTRVSESGRRSHAADFSEDGSSCLVALPNSRPRLIDLTSIESIELTDSDAHTTAVEFDAVRQQWLTGDKAGRVTRRALAGDRVSDFQAHNQPVTGIRVIDDRILTVSRDNTLREWTTAGQKIAEREEHRFAIKAIEVSQSAKTLATADRAGNIYLWDPLTLDLRLIVSESDHAIETLHFLEDDCLASSATREPFLRFWGNRPPDPD